MPEVINLYVKEHTKTKLKYFGKTIRKDPQKYLGSGVLWRKHINKHGKEYVKTLEVWSFDSISEANAFALNFSERFNIVESKDWANLIDETGVGGGRPRGFKHPELVKQKMSESSKGNKHRVGKTHSTETRIKMSQSHSNKVLSSKHKKNLSLSKQGKSNPQYGKFWVTNGIVNKMILPCDYEGALASGFKKGRTV